MSLWSFLVWVYPAFWVLRRDLYQFLRIFRTQNAERMGMLLDPYPIAPSFVHFPSLDALAPAPLTLIHYRQWVYILVWHDSPSVASTGPIFKRCKIETFVTSSSWRDESRHCSIETRSNDGKSKLKQSLDVSYTGETTIICYLYGGRVRIARRCSLFYRNNEIQTFYYYVSLSCFVWIYNHTVRIVSHKYWELCLISETILIGFLYFRETTC